MKRKYCGILLVLLLVEAASAVFCRSFTVSTGGAGMLAPLQHAQLLLAGLVPGVDFPSSDGVLAALPFTLSQLYAPYIWLAPGAGPALIWGQGLMLAVALPVLLWAVLSRMDSRPGTLLSLAVVGLFLALTPGLPGGGETMDHYAARWCWAWASLVVVLVVVPARSGRADTWDGLALGMAMAALLTIRAEFAVGLGLPVMAGLIYQYRARVLAIAIAVLLVVWAVPFWIWGTAFWNGYARAVLAAYPGPWDAQALLAALLAQLTAVPVLAGLVSLAAALLLRRASLGAGNSLLLMLPALWLLYALFPDSGPVWLLPVVVCLLALMPGEGDGPRRALSGVGLAGVVLALPGLVTLLASPARHLWLQSQPAHPVMPPAGLMAAGSGDALTLTLRVGPSGEPLRDAVVFGQRLLPDCETTGGVLDALRAQAEVLEGAGLVEGRQPFVADLYSAHWLFSDLAPLQGGAPRQEAGLPGWDDAGYLLVPDCPVSAPARRRILAEIEAAEGPEISEVFRGEQFTLYALRRWDTP